MTEIMTVFIIFAVLVVIFAIYLFLIAPKFSHKGESYPEKGYAHRGLWNDKIPENSYSAFSAAVANGYGIETDVQLTSDKVPVLMHDDTLTRMCGDNRRVCDCTFDEIRSLRLNETDEVIPTLEGFLKLVGGQVPLLIELKGITTGTELCDVIAPILDRYDGVFCVESFNPLLLAKMKKLRPKIARGQLVTALVAQRFPGNIIRNAALSAMMLNFLSRPSFIAYDKHFADGISLFMITRIFRARRMVWTVRGKAEYEKTIKHSNLPIFEHIGDGKTE